MYEGNQLFNCNKVEGGVIHVVSHDGSEPISDVLSPLSGYGPIIFWTVLGIVAFFTLVSAVYTVDQQTAVVVERFGKFLKISTAGLKFKIPFVDDVSTVIDLQIEQLDVVVETKTEDNVFVKVLVAVQHFVLPEKVFEAAYKLSNPEAQITAYVFDVVRAKVPRLKLDDLFEKKDEIADAVKNELADVMDDFGYSIVKALVTDIDPDQKVKESMNEINAAQRLRLAATEKGEADRILAVKAAEAEAQSKALQGKGIADQRKAIADGLRETVEQFQAAVAGATAGDVMQLVMATQYFDTLKEIGTSWDVKTLVMPATSGMMPGSLADTMSIASTPQAPPATPRTLGADS